MPTLVAQPAAELQLANAPASVQMGRAMAFADNEHLLLSALDYHTGTNSSVCVFKKQNNEWLLTHTITKPDTETDPYFGLGIAACSQKTIITAYKSNNGNRYHAGAAYFYRQLANGNWQLTQKIIPSDSSPYQLFGSAVAMNQEWAFISAPGNAQNGLFGGAVYVYKYNGKEWIQYQKIVSPYGGANEEFGHALSLHNHTLAIGAWGYANANHLQTGAAYIYNYDGKLWNLSQHITPPDGAENDRFAWSLSLNNQVLAIGAPGNNQTGPNMGAVYLYAPNNLQQWTLQQKIAPTGGIHGAALGTQTLASISERRIWVSAEQVRTAAGPEGAVYEYAYQPQTNTWEPVAMPAKKQPCVHAKYGAVMAAHQNVLAISAYKAATATAPHGGCAFVYATNQKTDIAPTNPIPTNQPEISVYPNPVVGKQLTVETNGHDIETIRITHINGQTCLPPFDRNSQKCTILLPANFPAGLAVVELTTHSGSVTNYSVLIF